MKYTDLGRNKALLEQEGEPTIQFNEFSPYWEQYQKWISEGNIPEVKENILFPQEWTGN